MSDTRDTTSNTSRKIAETAKGVANTVAEKAGQAKEWVEDKTGMGCGTVKSRTDVRERMDVIASCGKKVGVVDHVEGGTIKLTKNDSPDGRHHFIPSNWVDHVDNHVHLNKNSREAEAGWKSDTGNCGL